MQVLVIDDDVAVRQTIALLLEDAGIEAIQAADVNPLSKKTKKVHENRGRR